MKPFDPSKFAISHIEKTTVVYHTTWDHQPLSSTKHEVLCIYEEKKFLFTTISIDINKDGNANIYAVGGGSARPDAIQTINCYYNIVKNISNAKKLILFGHYTACPRNIDIDTGKLLAHIIENGIVHELSLQEKTVALGTSAGCIPSLSFITALEQQRRNNLKLVLIEPVGFVKNPTLKKEFLLTPVEICRIMRKQGKSSIAAMREAYKQLIDSWGAIYDKKGNILSILLDSIYRYKKFLEGEYKRHLIPLPVRSFSPPTKSLEEGLYEKQAQQLQGNVSVAIIVGNYGIDPIVRKYRNKSNEQIAQVVYKHYKKHAFQNITDMRVYCLTGSHILYADRAKEKELASILETA